MRGIFMALAAMVALGLTTSSARADTTTLPSQALDAKVQHALLTPSSAQGEVQPVFGWRGGWRGGYGGYYGGYRPYYGHYGFYRPYHYGGFYRPYYGGYWGGHRPFYRGGFYRPYYGGYWW